jgi:putative oxidoreductase
MPLATQVLQRLFGLALLSFVLMGTGLIPWQPPPVSIRAQPLRDAIFSSGYIIPVVLIVYLLSGLAFVSDRFVALGCLVLFPVSLNILLFHAFLNPRSVPLALAVFVPNVLLMWAQRIAYQPLLK